MPFFVDDWSNLGPLLIKLTVGIPPCVWDWTTPAHAKVMKELWEN